MILEILLNIKEKKIMGRDRVQLVGCFPGRHEALGSTPNTPSNQVWCHLPVISVLKRQRQKDKKFKIILDHTVSSRLRWGT